ncbi:hypothetical protein ACWF94_04290 [Streptomyces sp. NPDC055078]
MLSNREWDTVVPDDFDLESMRRFVADYESFEDPYLQAEFLLQNGTTFDAIRRNRQLIAAADRHPTGTPRPGVRTRRGNGRRQGRPPRVGPPGYPRGRRGRTRRTRVLVVTVRILVEVS